MREYQPVLVAAASVNYTYPKSVSSDLRQSKESEQRSPMSTDSQFTVLTGASSTLSIVSQAQNCDWPEFQESYNSIMDNTNLLDSCAAALNDISSEDDTIKSKPKNLRCVFNRSLSSTTTNSSFSGSDTVTTKSVEQFTRWLCEMETRVAAQPKLSRIVAMMEKQMAAQLELHSKIFKEIVAQPCIVKGAKRPEYKLLEDRYHLMYLKVYEVLLLLEGLPANSFSPSNSILSDSLQTEFSTSTNSKEHSSDEVDADNESLSSCDKNETELKTPMYTETNVLSTSIGTYYFNYDDSIEQSTDNEPNEKLTSTNIFENTDKELTFEHDLHLLLNATDNICLKSHEQTLVTEEHRPLQQPLTEEPVVASPQKSHIWTEIDFGELAAQPLAATGSEYHSTQDIELAHRKVHDWLHFGSDSCKSKSMLSLNCSAVATSETDYQLLYRAKSEMDLSMWHALEPRHRTSSLRTSLNCIPSILSPTKPAMAKLNGSVSSDSSLIWDNYHLENEQRKIDSDFGLSSSDCESKEIINKLCYFGDDYSQHLNESTPCDSEQESQLSAQSVMHLLDTPTTSKTSSSRVRRSRRIRNKRLRSHSSSPISYTSSTESCSTLSLGQSDATTASVHSSTMSSMCQEEAQEKFMPQKTISYDSNAKHFELHTKESSEPKTMKINEMRPEDFYDIVKLCQSNIDCVITVLGADPNRILTVAYCQQMKFERYQKSNDSACKCKQESCDSKQRTKGTECNDSYGAAGDICKSNSGEMCVCAWVSHTIAMLLNFLIDCWNVFRNMKLYTYLCRFTKSLFGSTRHVADHLKSKRELVNTKAIKYS